MRLVEQAPEQPPEQPLAEQLGAAWREAMLAGEFEQAWRASDRIRALGGADPHRFWQGEPLAGRRVMLRCLHGFGDSVQFLRYVPRLKATAASLCVEVAPRMVELARCLEGVDEVITWGEGAPACAPAWDVQMEVTELPYVFRTQAAELPVAARYLRVEPAGSVAGDSLLQVGLAWRAGEWNAKREIPIEVLRPVLEVAGCEFWNLTTGFVGAGMREDAHCRESVLGLARRIATLDLVITVDTLAAHLAGALGVRGWVMLQQACDWRWMRARDDSPWYPSLRLFRQGEDGVWEEVVARIASALSAWVAERRAGGKQ